MTGSLLCIHGHSFRFVLAASSLADVPTEGPWRAGVQELALVAGTCQLFGRSWQWVDF